MADAAQLKLQVGLDLAFFRQQLAQLGNTAAGYALPINIDRLGIQKEITKLGKNISSRKYTLKITSDVSGINADIIKLQKALENLGKESVNIQVTGTGNLNTKEARKIRTDLRASILANGGKIKVPATITAAITKADITAFKNAVKSKLNGVSVDVKVNAKGSSFAETEQGYSGLTEFMKKQGLIGKTASGMTGQMREGGDNVKQQLNDAVQSAQKIKSIFDGVAQSIATTGKSTATIQGKRLGLANVPLMVGGVEKKIERSSAAIGGTTSFDALQALYPEVSKTITSLAALKGQIQQNTSKLSGFSLILGLAAFAGVPLAKSVVKLTGSADNFAKLLHELGLKLDAAFTKAASNILNATSGRLLSAGSVAGLLPAAYRGIESSAGAAGMLPPAYRGITGAPTPKGIGGTIFGAQKYLPTALGNETKEVLRDAANAFLDTIKQGIREVRVQDLGKTINSQAVLSGTNIAGLLPAAIGRTPSMYSGAYSPAGETKEQMLARRTAEAYARSGLRGIAPPTHFTQQQRLPGTIFMGDEFTSGGGRDRVRGVGQPPQRGGALSLRSEGAPTPLGTNYYKNAFRYAEALKVADASMKNFSASQIPFLGGLRGAAGELGQATKQVLLYGTAYRALAAITSIPGQILNAAKSQQQYTNGLKVATEETGTFAKELLFVDNVQRAFGLNLETTRTGFTRLYASMAPTGFDSGSIEKLFTGISAATAALQLTPDKAERVIYAFGQMASKGQIMSEELKGQLGDVLPGALAIFAKSAGMSVKEFSKAMEDGEFVGSRFREVFAKVSDELMTRFGTGAQAAGKSLQGLLSTVGGDFQRTLESFAPLANNVAQAILVPLGGALRQLSTSAQIAMGEMDRVKGQYQTAKIDLGDLRAGGASADQIRAAEQNVAALEARYKLLNKALEDPAITKQVKDIQLFTQELTKAGIFVMNVAKAIGGILSPVINFLGTNLTATIATITSFYIGFQSARLAAMALMGVLLLYRGLSAMLGLSTAAQQATALSGAFNVLGVSASRANVALIGTRAALTALVAATVVGAVVAGIVAIASAFATMGDKARDAAQASKDAGKAAMDAASTGNVAAAEMGVQAVLAESRKNTAARKALEAIQRRSTVDQRKGAVPMSITSEESVALQGSALTAGMIKAGVSRGGVRQIQALTKELMDTTLKQFGSLAGQAAIDLKEAKSAVNQARKVSVKTGLNKPTPNPLTEDEDTKKKQNLESYYSLQDTLAKNAANFAAAQAEEDFNHRIELLERYYDIQEARANAYQKDAIRFEREMVMIEAKRQEARLKAELDVQRARSSVAGGAPGVGATATGAAKLPGSISGRLDASGQNGADMPVGPNNTIQSYHNGLVKALGTAGNNGNYIVIDFIDDLGNRLEATYSHVAAAVKVGQSVVGGQTIGRFDASGRTTGPHNSIDINSLGNNGSLQRGRETSAAQRSADILLAGGVQGRVPGLDKTAPAKVTGDEKRDAVAAQNTLQASIAKTATNRRADAKAAQEQIAAFEKYRAAAFPTTEQDMQNKLLARRNELFKSGMTDERIDQEIKLYENQERGAAGLAVLDRLLTKKILTDTQHATLTKELNQDIANQNNLLQQNATLVGQSKFDQALKGLRDQIDMAKALTPEAEMRTRLQQQGYAGPQLETLFETEKAKVKAEELKAKMQGVASTISDAFSTAFQGIINGSMSAQDALAGMFQSIGQSFIKMAMDMIAQQVTMITLGFIMKALGLLGSAAGAGSTPLPGSAPQMTPNAIVTPTGFQGMIPANFAAKGATFSNGIAKFATGGIVHGPTLFPFADGGAMQMGLMGEAGPEAILPLQRGADGALGVRAAMGGNGMGGSSGPVLSMSFETSTINGVEYVSRDQLEAAMAQTRRQASSDGAKRGMAMTLDKIQQSPQTRRRIGM